MTKIAILTPLDLEMHAVKAHISEWQEIIRNGDLFYQSTFKINTNSFQIILHKTGSKNHKVGFAVQKIVQEFQPQIIFLTGIAGGVKDVKIGDVVIGEKAYGYDAGKEKDGKFWARPEVYHASKSLLKIAELVHSKNEWRSRLGRNSDIISVFFGPIAAGDKVIADKNLPSYQLIKNHYNDTLALEMEAYGMGAAMLNFPNILWLNIRGISDLLEGKNAAEDIDNQPIAAENAAAFLFEVINQLEISELNIPIMNSKELSKVIFDILFPITKLESVKDIGKDFAEAANTSIKELWEKVSPLFIEEYEDLKDEPKDEDNQAAVRSKLNRVLRKNDSLKMDLENLVNQISKQQGNITSRNISNSKNSISGDVTNSTVQIGDTKIGTQTNISDVSGEVVMGDKIINIHNHTSSTNNSTQENPSEVSTDAQEIRNMLSAGNTKRAIEALLDLSQSQDSSFHNQAVLLASRWNGLQKKVISGIISESNSNIEQNRIAMGVLGMLEE